MNNSAMIYKKLDKLPESVRATVNIIHSRYEQGASIRYADIQKARIEIGMAEGSSVTLKKAFDAWRDIYDIKFEKYESLDQVDKLVKHAVEIIRDKIKLAYEQETETKINASNVSKKTVEIELAQTQTELSNTKKSLNDEQVANTKLRHQLEELLLEKEALLEQKRDLDKDASNLRVNVSALGKRLIDKDKQVTDLNKNFDSLRSEMESQRQAQLVVIDEHRQEAKRASKLVDELRDKVEQRERQLSDSKQQVVSEKELNKSLKAEFSAQEKRLLDHAREKGNVTAELRQDNQSLHDKIAKLEVSLETERQSHNKQSEALFARLEKMITDSQKPKKEKA
jgi:chromosome segregation ATPase